MDYLRVFSSLLVPRYDFCMKDDGYYSFAEHLRPLVLGIERYSNAFPQLLQTLEHLEASLSHDPNRYSSH